MRKSILLSAAAVAALTAPSLTSAQPAAGGHGKGKPGEKPAIAAAGASAAPGAADAAAPATPGEPKPEVYTIAEHKPATDVFTFDYGPPTSPALKLSGLAVGDITASTALKPFVLSIPSLLNGDAKGQAVGLDFNPYAALDAHYSWTEYRAMSQAEHAWRRVRVNLLGYRGVVDASDASKNKASKLAFGLSSTLLDQSDPGLTGENAGGFTYWERCANSAFSHFKPSPITLESDRQASLTNDHKIGRLTILRTQLESADWASFISRNGAEIDSYLGTHYADAPVAREPSAPAATDKDDAKALVAALKAKAERSPDDRELFLRLAQYVEAHEAKPSAAPKAPKPAAEPTTPPPPAQPAANELHDLLDAKIKELNGLRVGLRQSARAEQVKDSEAFTKAAATCAKRASLEAAASAKLDVGLGSLWNGQAGQFRKFDKGGGALWIAAKWPFKVYRDDNDELPDLTTDDPRLLGKGDQLPTRIWAIGASARYAWRDDVQTGDKATPSFSADTYDVWAGLETSTEASRFAVQIGRYNAEARDDALDRFSKAQTRWLATAALRLSDAKTGMWGNITYGEANGTSSTLKDKTLLFTLSFGPVDAPELFNKPK